MVCHRCMESKASLFSDDLIRSKNTSWQETSISDRQYPENPHRRWDSNFNSLEILVQANDGAIEKPRRCLSNSDLGKRVSDPLWNEMNSKKQQSIFQTSPNSCIDILLLSCDTDQVNCINTIEVADFMSRFPEREQRGDGNGKENSPKRSVVLPALTLGWQRRCVTLPQASKLWRAIIHALTWCIWDVS